MRSSYLIFGGKRKTYEQSISYGSIRQPELVGYLAHKFMDKKVSYHHLIRVRSPWNEAEDGMSISAQVDWLKCKSCQRISNEDFLDKNA